MITRIAMVLTLMLTAAAPLYADFDERLWESYTEITAPLSTSTQGLGSIYLEPYLLGNLTGATPFADLRVMDDRKREVPWQLIVKRPAALRDELPVTVSNRSTDAQGNSWIEGRFDTGVEQFNAVELDVADEEFYRQVQILGSNDGTAWNTLRADGVIFDRTRGDRLRHTRVSIPRAGYRHVGVRIINAAQPPLDLRGLKILRTRDQGGLEQSRPGQVGPMEKDDNGQTGLTVKFASRFPLNRLEITTPDRNFQRQVTVQVKQGDSWRNVATGNIFRYESGTVRESSLKIDVPDIASDEIRLQFHNHDSPALNVSQVSGVSYRRQLVFLTEPGRSYYLFWNNPAARMPQYDLSGLVAKVNSDTIPVLTTGGMKPNTRFAGDSARLPLSERYRWLLYAAMGVVVAGLLALQFRVLRRSA